MTTRTTAPETAVAPPRAPLAPRPVRPEHEDRVLVRHWPVTILLMPVAILLLSFWPGHMSADTLVQIDQVAGGYLTNQHAPLLLALWTPLWDLGIGPGWVLTAQVSAFAAGCYLLLRATLGRLAAALGASAIVLFPPVFGNLGILGRDAWFVSTLLLAFGCAATAARRTGRARVAWLAGIVLMSWLCLAARQNAAAAVALALVALVALLLPAWASRRRLVAVAVAGGLALTLGLMGMQVVAQNALGVQDVNPEQYLYMYDLGALSHDEHRNLFPRSVLFGDISDIEARWNKDSMAALVYPSDAPIHPWPLPEPRERALASTWRSQIGKDPLAYLNERARLWLRQVSVTRDPVWIYHPVIDPNNREFAVRFSGPNRAAKRYVEAFAINENLDGGPLFWVWPYLLACAALAVVLLRRRSAPVLVLGALALAAVTYQSGLFVGAMGTVFRFEFPIVVIAVVTAVAACGLLVRRGAPPTG